MNQETQKYTPPVYPLVAQVPPPQTNIGSLNENGLPILNTIKINGEPPNEELWGKRLEYVDSFVVSTADTPGKLLMSFDPARLLGNKVNNTNYLECSLVWPRVLLFNSSIYFKAKIKYTFWAIKPPATAGKLRIVYIPGAGYFHGGDKDPTISYNNDVQQNDDTYLRNYMWEWDLATKNMFTITVEGNNPLDVFPTKTAALTNPDKTYVSNGYLYEPDAGCPIFSINFGSINISVQNQYIPGSIFPDNFRIVVFKHFENLENFVQVGPRSYAHAVAI
jgi:hypothetical protein